MEIIMTTGLPASGKSTWAKRFVSDSQLLGRKWKRINKDDLRAMLDTGIWSKENEDFLISVRDFVITQCLLNDISLVVDDVNHHPMHKARIKELIQNFNPEALFRVKSFWDVSVDECIARDRVRSNSVGEKVIRRLQEEYEKYNTKA